MATDSPNDPFAEAYRAYLKAMQKAWAEVDVDELAATHNDARSLGYSSAGTLPTIGTIACVGTIGGCLGSAGTFGSIALKPEQD
jgi:hypothetical protein